MARRFISIPIKISVLIIGSLLALALVFSSLSIWQMQQDIEARQQQLLSQSKQQLEFHHQIFVNQLTSWIESFSAMTHLENEKHFQQFTKQFAAQFDSLQFNFDVSAVWLVSQKQGVLFQSRSMPTEIAKQVAQVFMSQKPFDGVLCYAQCQQVILVPVINGNGDIAVIAMTSSMVEVLYGIQSMQKNNLAIVSVDTSSNFELAESAFITNSDKSLFQRVWQQHANLDISELIQSGRLLKVDNHDWFISFIELYRSRNKHYYLAILDDITLYVQQQNNLRWQYIGLLVLVFCLLALASFKLSNRIIDRILHLAQAVPLLAKRQYAQFRQQIEEQHQSRYEDEIDVLSKAASDVNNQLEHLDIELQAKTRELESIAMYDILTGLPNRNMLNFHLKRAIEQIDLLQRKVAVLFLDLDDFKKVNDSHGHPEGDLLLIEAANRLKQCVHKSDLVARFGGDEFVIVLSQVVSLEQAILVAKEIIEQFKIPVKLKSNVFYVTASIGIAYTDSPLFKGEDLVRQADIAMYEAKKEGNGQYYLFDKEMYRKVANRVVIESEVRDALKKQEFKLCLQPQVSAQDYRIIGFEALLRWHHGEKGMISPADFIPVLESSSYMIELGYWIIRHCFELAKKLNQYPQLDKSRIAINLSAIQFSDPELLPFIQNLLHEFELPAYRFELEITEQTLVKDIDHAVELMIELKSLGFTFAIDDYGTGYSSLSYLKSMPIDVLKIDKSFIDGMLDNHSDFQIIMSTIAMAKNLGLEVVAEGVETVAQLKQLQQHHCDYIQGYYFSKPISEDELDDFLTKKVQDGRLKNHLKPAM